MRSLIFINLLILIQINNGSGQDTSMSATKKFIDFGVNSIFIFGNYNYNFNPVYFTPGIESSISLFLSKHVEMSSGLGYIMRETDFNYHYRIPNSSHTGEANYTAYYSFISMPFYGIYYPFTGFGIMLGSGISYNFSSKIPDIDPNTDGFISAGPINERKFNISIITGFCFQNKLSQFKYLTSGIRLNKYISGFVLNPVIGNYTFVGIEVFFGIKFSTKIKKNEK